MELKLSGGSIMDLNGKKLITPNDPFPENLNALDDTTLEVLYARVRRELDAEQLDCDPQLETEDRLEELRAELDRRETNTALG
ncbi:hypothetical protein [Arthrobacter sp. HLT1-21]